MSQNTEILNHLKQGKTINPLEALVSYGCFRLARVINDLRNLGYKIITTIVKRGGKRFAEYSL